MAISLHVTGGPGEIIIQPRNEKVESIIKSVRTISDTPDHSSARSNDLDMRVEITGQIIAHGSDNNATLSLANWSKIPTHSEKAYANVEISYDYNGTKVRNITMSHAFIVSYKESFGNNGTFTLVLRQKKDNLDGYQCAGNF